jgi:recA bacterial DNA recombination protein
MRAVVSKAEIEAEIVGRFGKALTLQGKPPAPTLSTGVSTLDQFMGGIPRGAVTEIFGRTSSGRTSLLFSILAHATTHEEICAIVDTHDVFAPTVAAGAGINFDNLLWVRCAASLEHAFKATDLLLHAGGFGLVVLDLGEVVGKEARRIISSWWHRFKHTVENKPVTVVVLAAESCVRSCAALSLELTGQSEWVSTNEVKVPAAEICQWHRRKPTRLANTSSQISIVAATHGNLLRVNSIAISRHRPIIPAANEVQFNARAG